MAVASAAEFAYARSSIQTSRSSTRYATLAPGLSPRRMYFGPDPSHLHHDHFGPKFSGGELQWEMDIHLDPKFAYGDLFGEMVSDTEPTQETGRGRP